MKTTLPFTRIAILLAVLSLLVSCNMPAGQTSPAAAAVTPTPGEAMPAPASVPETLISFRVIAPPNTPDKTQVYLSILDEVTGLALNATTIPMEVGAPIAENKVSKVYVITLPFPIGTVIKYRYERSAELAPVAEHLSDGSAVRYRIYHVTGQGMVDDVISRWTDTAYSLESGRIAGVAKDVETGQPVPGLLVSAGGAQTVSASNGSFLLEGLPPGVHNLTLYAMDGVYQPFQQGARVAAESTTPAEIQMKPAKFTEIVFAVKVPEGTLPVVPLRMAGNLTQFGDAFANLSLGAAVLPVNMPRMSTLPDGRYTLTMSLPVGADIRYKYTLGDGFWNAERSTSGGVRLRQFIVPNHPVLVEDIVDTWSDAGKKTLTFDLQVPADTPAGDFISIQFNPLIGWTEPIPMWNLGNERWAYILYSPLNLSGELSYRYCRNGQCDRAGDTEGERKVTIGEESQTLSDRVSAWKNWSGAGAAGTLPAAVEVAARPDGFWAGFEMAASYHPSWTSLFSGSLAEIKKLNANMVILTPSWSYGRAEPGNSPPLLSQQPERNATWFALNEMLASIKSSELKAALYPQAYFHLRWDQWWANAPRQDPGWWPVWFQQYGTFIGHHADVAMNSQAEALILGGDWLAPALPGGTLADGQPAGAPQDAEERWRSLLADVRSRYSGKLLWAISPYGVENPPPFLDVVDGIYLTISLAPGQQYGDLLGMELEAWLDGVAWPFQINSGLPIVLALEIPAGDAQIQSDLLQQALTAATKRDWIGGVIVRGYDPAVALQDASASVNGKPASALLAMWYQALLGK